jgi:threonine dehydrogenase-like Zn-dependent dehydrogenase
VSRGSETLVFRGGVPRSEWGRMRAPFQAGEFPAPVKYGYASVGRVLAGPAALQGRNVLCLHPHQTQFVVPATAVLPLPEDVPARRAILAPNLETAVNAVWDAAIRPGDRVAVIGAGSVGCLTAWLVSRIAGCRVELVDVNPRRRPVAAALGVIFADAASAQADCDVVMHASGSRDGLALALRLAGFEATVIEMSWYGDREVSVPLGEAFHSRRLTLRASQVGSVATARRARWTHATRLAFALSLLTDPALDSLITAECAFADLPRVMSELAQGAGDVIMQAVRYS